MAKFNNNKVTAKKVTFKEKTITGPWGISLFKIAKVRL